MWEKGDPLDLIIPIHWTIIPNIGITITSAAIPTKYKSAAAPKYRLGDESPIDVINNTSMIKDGKTTGVVNVVIINESCSDPGPLMTLFTRAKIVNIAIKAENEYRLAPNTVSIK